jgi:hypothetical protein
MIVMKVSGQVLLLEVDTGSSGLILFEGQVKDKLDLKKRGRRISFQHIAGRSTLKEFHLKNASIGKT